MKKVPHKEHYDFQRKISSVGEWLLYALAIIASLRFVLDSYQYFEEFASQISQVLESVTAYISVVYIVADIIQGYLFLNAERCRTLDFLDNSLGSKFSEENSEGYFSNNEVDTGIFKLGVNGFENAFFTMSVTKTMRKGLLIKMGVLFLIVLGICVTSSGKLFSLAVQTAIVASILLNGVKLLVLHSRVTQIYLDYRATFSMTDKECKEASIIKCVLLYEKTLCWAGIQLHVGAFNKLNPNLSIKWAEIKQRIVK